MGTQPEVFVIAGEPSGDEHAAMLGRALAQSRDLKLRGVGQRRMSEAGFELLFDSTGWSAIGVLESLKRVPALLVRRRQLSGHLLALRPDLLVLVDFGAFNVRLARSVRRALRPILYYFPPRSWSRDADYRGLAPLVDRVATPFRWSEALLRQAGIDARWVGHPVVDRIHPPSAAERATLRQRLGVEPGATVVGLMPGSRRFEIRYNCPQLLGAGLALSREIPQLQLLLSVAPSIAEETLEAHVARAGLEGRVRLLPGVAEIVAASDLVITACGTATLEAAAAACPMIIMYDVGLLGRLETTLRRFDPGLVGMPNIIAGEEIVPELLGNDARAAQLADRALEMLGDEDELSKTRELLLDVRAQLGDPGVSDRVAGMALEMLATH